MRQRSPDNAIICCLSIKPEDDANLRVIYTSLLLFLYHIIIMLTDLRLDNRRGWVRGWVKLCTCLIG